MALETENQIHPRIIFHRLTVTRYLILTYKCKNTNYPIYSFIELPGDPWDAILFLEIHRGNLQVQKIKDPQEIANLISF